VDKDGINDAVRHQYLHVVISLASDLVNTPTETVPSLRSNERCLCLLMLYVGLLLSLGFAVQARSDTACLYIGSPFTAFHGTSACPPQCNMSGFFTTATPLAPDLVENDGQFQFDVTPTSYEFTDGVTVATNFNSCFDFFSVGTDNSGNVVSYTVHGAVNSTAQVSHLENGQTVISVTSTLEDSTHSHTITVGAEDGHDALSNRDESAALGELQKHLDEQRQRAADVLAGRAQVKKITQQLQ
jgi:hypothetical protein